jgi:hypothetical protein
VNRAPLERNSGHSLAQIVLTESITLSSRNEHASSGAVNRAPLERNSGHSLAQIGLTECIILFLFADVARGQEEMSVVIQTEAHS